MRGLLRLLAAASTAALAVFAPAAQAAAGSGWVHLDGPNAGPQVALLRVAGILHVVWAQGRPATIHDTTLDADGNAIHTVTVTQTFDGLAGLALLRMPDGTLRLFAAGGHTVNLPPNGYGINDYVAPADGTGWTRDPTPFWANLFASGANQIGAVLSPGGQVALSFDAHVHFGLAANRPPTDVATYQTVCCAYDGTVAVDGATGHVVLSWKSGAAALIQEIVPTKGQKLSLPIASANPDGSGIAARLGPSGGVYVAYAEQSGAVRLYRYGGGTIPVASGAPYQLAKVFAAPDGRLWLVWGDSRDGVYVERSNRALTAFEKVQHFALPPGSELFDADGEGSAGPLDLFLFDGENFWRMHVLALDALHATESAMTVQGSGGTQVPELRVTLTLTDAGDPVAGAAVTVSGIGATHHLTTDGAGEVTLTLLHSGTLHIVAAAHGYRTATLTVPVNIPAPQAA